MILANLSGTDLAVGIIISVVGFVLTILAGLITYIFNEFRKDMAEKINELNGRIDTLNGKVDLSGRHLDSIMTTVWGLIWRVNNIEDFLEVLDTRFKIPRLPPERE